ncbi:hypothetical protein AB0H43_12445 [Hamadaea sp. NPDC050747]|uniref:hypothetical protein n=1 Tax=Hamadaea sp. NPDC050747 TaxID=3155789 RepID=UPI003402A930
MDSGAERLRRLIDEAEASRHRFEGGTIHMAALSAVADDLVAQLTAAQDRAVEEAQRAIGHLEANRRDPEAYAAAKDAYENAQAVTAQVEAGLRDLLSAMTKATDAGLGALRDVVHKNEALLRV